MKAITVEYKGAMWHALVLAGWEPSAKVRNHQMFVAPGGRNDELDRIMSDPIWVSKELSDAQVDMARLVDVAREMVAMITGKSK